VRVGAVSPLTGLRVIAGVLTWYAMAGFALAAMMVNGRDPRLDWALVAAAGALLGVSGGGAALSVWRRRRWAPIAVVVSGVAGAVLCVALPLSVRGGAVPGEMWRASLGAAALFGLFCGLLAWYVRRWTRVAG
jgi:hypothetical protein